MDKVLILLSTYNGSKFLSEQLDSIFNQLGCQFKILVRDDGSTDSTVSILHAYQRKYKDGIDIIEGQNLGWKKSFFELVRVAHIQYNEFRYYTFCDQDDIWLPKKLFKGIKKLETLPLGPNLYCSNLFYYKEGKNYGLIRNKKIISTFKSCLVRNYATGCSVIFNHSLLSLVARNLPQLSTAHDYWFYQVAMLCGHVFIDEEAYILYRQHENNQIGSKSSFLDIWKRRLKELKNFYSRHEREKQAKELIRLFSHDMYPEALEATKKMAYYRRSVRFQLALLCDKEYTLGKASNDRWLKLRIILRCL